MDKGGFDERTTSRRALLLGLAASMALPLLGCAPEDSGLVMADGVGREDPPAGAPVAKALDGLTAFGHQLTIAAARPGKNFVASPLSIAVAFAMLRAGAGGTTAAELDTVFGFPAAGRDEAYNAISGRLATDAVPPKRDTSTRDPNQPSKPPVVSIGNALFPQKGFAVGQDFLRTLARQYGAGVRPVDFADDAAEKINSWVDRQTAGRITKVFEHLDPFTKLVLVNTVYFKADWQRSLDPLGDMPFTKADGSQAKTAFVGGAQVGVRYAETGGITAIELPYASGPYAMWLMLPPSGGKPEDALAPRTLARLKDAFAPAQADVQFPKWDFQTGIDLKDVLERMGVRSAFADADLSGIAPGLFVSQATHTANITVDEWGTEAAAVTGIATATGAPAPAPLKFVADRPYAFAIVGGDDRVPLFIGRVSDPSAN